MPLGIVPSGDGWKTKSFSIASASRVGDLISLNDERQTIPYVSIQSQYLGVGLHDSVDSLPTGNLLVAIPSIGAEATVDLPTGLTASQLSYGQVYSIYSRSGRMSYLTTLFGSAFSQFVTVEGVAQTSRVSRILVSFRGQGVVGSASSLTFEG